MTSSEGELDRLAANLVRAPVDVLVTWPTPPTLAAMRASLRGGSSTTAVSFRFTPEMTELGLNGDKEASKR